MQDGGLPGVRCKSAGLEEAGEDASSAYLVKVIIRQEGRSPDVERPLHGIASSVVRLLTRESSESTHLFEGQRHRQRQHRIRDQSQSRGRGPRVGGDVVVRASQQGIVEWCLRGISSVCEADQRRETSPLSATFMLTQPLGLLTPRRRRRSNR